MYLGPVLLGAGRCYHQVGRIGRFPDFFGRQCHEPAFTGAVPRQLADYLELRFDSRSDSHSAPQIPADSAASDSAVFPVWLFYRLRYVGVLLGFSGAVSAASGQHLLRHDHSGFWHCAVCHCQRGYEFRRGIRQGGFRHHPQGFRHAENLF